MVLACNIQELPISDDEILSYMGYGDKKPSCYIQSIIDNLKTSALDFCKPVFNYYVVDGSVPQKGEIELNGVIFNPGAIITRNFKGSAQFIIIVASMGKEFDLWIESKINDVMEYFIADILGSVFVEAIVMWGVETLEKIFKDQLCGISNSYSPGYCGWDVKEQQELFSLLPDDFTHVTLTPSSLMLPIKSISGVIGVAPDMKRRAYGCAICNKQDCYKRKKIDEL